MVLKLHKKIISKPIIGQEPIVPRTRYRGPQTTKRSGHGKPINFRSRSEVSG